MTLAALYALRAYAAGRRLLYALIDAAALAAAVRMPRRPLEERGAAAMLERLLDDPRPGP